MAEPNLDIGLDYTGGIAAPTVADVGRYARATLDNVGEPQLEYVYGVERRLSFSAGNHATITTTKTVAADVLTIAPNTFVDGDKSRLRVVIHGEFPARVGTKVGIDFFGNSITVQADLISAASLPPSSSTPFKYECLIYPGTSITQRVFGELRISTLAPIVSNTLLSPTGADMAVSQVLRVTGQLANVADVLLFRRIEVFGIGF